MLAPRPAAPPCPAYGAGAPGAKTRSPEHVDQRLKAGVLVRPELRDVDELMCRVVSNAAERYGALAHWQRERPPGTGNDCHGFFLLALTEARLPRSVFLI